MFHSWERQLKSKNFTNFQPPAAAQIVRRLEEKPKDCPKKMSKNITPAISAPETHQDQGCVMKLSIINGLSGME